MGWFSRFTRFGDAHMVYGQERDNSCGLASIMMCVFKINKLKPGAQALHTENAVIKTFTDTLGYAPQVGTNQAGTTGGELIQVLNKLNVGRWEYHQCGEGSVAGEIIDSVGTDIFSFGAGAIANAIARGQPIICGTDWDIRGGHWVVVDTVNNFFGSLYASVNDPYDADVHITPIERGKTVRYIAEKAKTSWDAGGVRHEYAAKPTGGKMSDVVVKVA
ncbi:MAG: hypothetical protein JO055_09550 [Alphaproteobacteria bacterium]|nr:hypothetical protein [Alphaproteobacteria bacterium]